MRVLMANKYFFPKGGSETVFFQEREGLIRNGHAVIDFSTSHPENLPSEFSRYFIPLLEYGPESSVANNPSFFDRLKYGLSFLHNAQALRILKTLSEAEQPHLAHLHNIYHQLTPSIIPMLKGMGIPVLLTVHDYKIVCPCHTMLSNGVLCSACQGGHFIYSSLKRCQGGSLPQSLLLSLEGYYHLFKGSYEDVDLFLCPSQFMADLLAQSRNLKEKVRVLRNGIDLRRYAKADHEAGYALYFGRVSMEKGIATLLRAAKSLQFRIPLKIVGSGPLLPDLIEAYPEVDFTGYKSGEQLAKLIRDASFIIVPSEWFENCSMSILQAMAYGKAVVASRIGGIPEQISHMQNGLLFESGNAEDLMEKMILLQNNPGLRRQMGDAAREKAQREYSLESHLEQLLEAYRVAAGISG